MHVLRVEPMPEKGSPSTILLEDMLSSIVNGMQGRGWEDSSWSAPTGQMESYTIWCTDEGNWKEVEAYLRIRPDVKEVKIVDGERVLILDLDYVDAAGLTYFLKRAGIDIGQLASQPAARKE